MQNDRRNRSWILIGLIFVFAAAAVSATRQSQVMSAQKEIPGPGKEGWKLAQPVTYENLTIFPVLASQEADTSEFATLDAALAAGDAVVTEQGSSLRRTRDAHTPADFSSGAQVNQLVLINRGKKPLVLLAGEVVSGGKQDRIIAKDRIVPAGAAPLPLDVFCVEHDRWTGASSKFSAGNLMVHPTVREKAAVEQDQEQVWASVRGDTAPVVGMAAGSSGVAPEAAPRISPNSLAGAVASARTQSYQEIYQASPIGASVENFAQEFERRFDREKSGLKDEHVVGVVVAFGGEVAWSDVFASSQMFDAYWPKLLRSYAVEALTRPAVREKVSLEDTNDFLRPAGGHVTEESEPGVYRWREQSEGRIAVIELAALAPRPVTLHWLRVLHTD
jgi:hypothetical protein